MRLGQENWKLWSLCPWLCLLVAWNRGAEGQGGEGTGQRWSRGGFNSKPFICCQGGSKHLWEGASPGQGRSSRAPAHTGMQQRLGDSTGAASFPSPPAQVVLDGDTSIHLSPRTSLRVWTYPPLHAFKLPPPPTAASQHIPSCKRTTWITEVQPIPPPWTTGDFSPVCPQRLPHVCRVNEPMGMDPPHPAPVGKGCQKHPLPPIPARLRRLPALQQ